MPRNIEWSCKECGSLHESKLRLIMREVCTECKAENIMVRLDFSSNAQIIALMLLLLLAFITFIVVVSRYF